jgi:lipopolysaccharide transport system ATP-binding protein
MVRIDNLGKRYRVGRRRLRQETLREVVTKAFSAPIRRIVDLAKPVSAEETLWALRGLSLEIPTGEVLGVIGSNGAGKSTLLKILSRVASPSEGRVELYGRSASLLEVGTGFHPELTGRENIFLNGAILGMRRREIEAKFDSIVAFAEIDRFVDTPVKRYSSGMYVRLAFAVAAHLDPEILLVDEILSVGDEAFRQKCIGELRQAAQSGRTVVFVSHNMQAIRNLCTRVLHLENGQLKMLGDTVEVVDTYLASRESICPERRWSSPADENSPVVPHLLRMRYGEVAEDGSANIAFDLNVEIARPLKLKAALQINTAEGIPLFSVESDFPKEGADDVLPVGHHQMTVQIDEPTLKSGAYFASLTLSHPLRGKFFHEAHAVDWRVNPPEDRRLAQRMPKGYVNSESRWQISPAAGEER